MRVRFFDVFRENLNGTLYPIKSVRIGGVVMSPGVSFSKGVRFGAVDIFNFYGKDIEIEDIGGLVIIKGFYG